MSFLNRLTNGLGTVLGVDTDSTKQVINEIRASYEEYRQHGGPTRSKAIDEFRRARERLHEANDEIMSLRKRRKDLGELSNQERRRWDSLREERKESVDALYQARVVKVAEKILDSEAFMEKIDVDLETTHVLQYNAIADFLGKKCSVCGRQMKLRWKRRSGIVSASDFYWACSGWHIQLRQGRACNQVQALQRSDYGLMIDASVPEFKITNEEFGVIITNSDMERAIATRLKDLRSDLAARGQGVELTICPVHGEEMVLREKSNPNGLLDGHFLACPYWVPPNSTGCSFIEQLKSGAQLAALLKSETGRGLL